ncbi:SMC family ATPase [Methanocalculus sp.]|uniref:AAA family ATPase n=1 Tax=Methanocalculus sp. TaxID=2004547 RepID=UPI002722C87F|nr:SMC family ATPase [Methanocalculus sp.]MDO8840826.1 SMC family ATPase [Methanocalculus sp.]
MILEELSLKNFKRYKYQDFTFKDGITAIIGSNGSGKSSVMEGIVFALYGISGSGIDPDYVVSSGAGPKERCEVRLTFSTGGERYIIARSFRKGQTTHHDASLNFADGRLIASGVSPVREAVLRILRMGPSDFRTTIYAPQRDLLSLLDKNPVERKRWFMRALGIERIRDGSWELIRKEIRTLEETIASLTGRLEEIDAERLKIQDKEEQEKEEGYKVRLAALICEEEEIGLAEAAAGRRLDELRQLMTELAKLRTSRANRQERILQLRRSLEEKNSELSLLQKDQMDFNLSAEKEAVYEEITYRAGQLRKAREEYLDASLRLKEAERRYEEQKIARSKVEERLSLVRVAEGVITRLSGIPAERERLVSERILLETAQKAYHRAVLGLATIESEIRVIREQAQSLMQEREKLKTQEQALLHLEERITLLDGITLISERCAEGERIQKECLRIEDLIKAIEGDIRGLRSDAIPLAEEVQKKEAACMALVEARSERELIRDRTATIRSELSSGKTSISEAERHLLELDQAGEESPCPTCGEPLKDRYQDARMRLLDQIQSLRSVQGTLRSELTSLEERLKREELAITSIEVDIAASTVAERKLAGIEARIEERVKEHERHQTLHQEKIRELTALKISDLDPARVKEQVEVYQSLIAEKDELLIALRRVPALESDHQVLTERAERLFSRMEEVISLREASGYSEDRIALVMREIRRLDPLYEEYRESSVLVREKDALLADLQSIIGQMDQISVHCEEIRLLIPKIGFDSATYAEAEEALRGAVENHERYLTLKGRVDRIPAVQADITRTHEEKEHGEADIERIDRELSLHSSVPETLEAIKREAEELSSRKRRCIADIREFTGLLAGVVQTRRRIIESITKSGYFEEERSRALSEKALLESTGIILKQFADHLIGSVRGRIEGDVGEILSLITDGRYEHVTIDDDFSIRVHEAGEDYPASRFSGGEQDDIAVALRIALSRHIAATHRIRDATVLIFDEIFGSQDEERRRHLIRALRKQEPYFPQILLISHIEGVQEECQTTIRVEEQPDLTSIALEVLE